MTQSRSDNPLISPHRKMGVQSPLALEPPPRGGGYWMMCFATLLVLLLPSVAIAQEQDEQPAVELSPMVTALL